MTDQEILQKAIKKAFPHGATGKIGALIMTLYEFKQDKFQKFSLERAIIFSHNFAKAFFGKGYVCGVDGSKHPYCAVHTGRIGVVWREAWKYHIQKMVLEEHPIQYLEKFI